MARKMFGHRHCFQPDFVVFSSCVIDGDDIDYYNQTAQQCCCYGYLLNCCCCEQLTSHLRWRCFWVINGVYAVCCHGYQLSFVQSNMLPVMTRKQKLNLDHRNRTFLVQKSLLHCHMNQNVPHSFKNFRDLGVWLGLIFVFHKDEMKH